MRLFLAVDIPLEVKKYLSDIKNGFKGKGRIAWVKEDNLHVTLKFLGEVKEEQVPSIISKLLDIQFKEFALGLGKLGFFPNKNSPRVFWANLTGVSELKKLASSIDEQLKEFKNDHAFKDHITLARIKSPSLEEKNTFFEKARKIKLESKTFVVQEFVLYQSILSEKSSKYVAISRFRG